MKKKIFSSIIVLIIAVVAAFNLNLRMQNNQLASLSLANVEALAQESKENIYRYDTAWNEVCYIYVGGVYAKGVKVTCWPGSEHPECATCKL